MYHLSTLTQRVNITKFIAYKVEKKLDLQNAIY